MAVKTVLQNFSKALKTAYQVQKNVTDVAAEYIDKLADEDIGGVTPEEMEEVTGDLDDLTTTAKTNLVAAINEVNAGLPVDPGSVSVTGDGVKTWSQLLDELFALIDDSKISYKSVLEFNILGVLSTYNFAGVASSPKTYRFTRCDASATISQVAKAFIKASGSEYIIVNSTVGGSIAYINGGAVVGDTGSVIRITY